ncbi:MAG: universal stress protein [Pseudomonadota bacterium]
MAIKDLAVAYDGSIAAQSALHFAIRKASRHDAALTGIHVYTPGGLQDNYKRWIPAEVLSNVQAGAKARLVEIESDFRNRVAEASFNGPVHWIVEEGQPAVALARRGRFYDFLVTGQFVRAIRREHSALQPEDLIHGLGKPLIIVPESDRVGELTGKAAIAWDGSRSAARALSDAMQILETKTNIDVVVVEGRKHVDDPYAPLPAEDIVEHLGRHGVKATEVRLKIEHGGPAQTLLAYCAQADPDVLVMGAFGRGKLGAMLFGSMTTAVLAKMTCPVLISH